MDAFFPGRTDPALGAAVAALLIDRNLSHSALARTLGVTQPVIRKWIAGTFRPSEPSYRRLCDFYHGTLAPAPRPAPHSKRGRPVILAHVPAEDLIGELKRRFPSMTITL